MTEIDATSHELEKLAYEASLRALTHQEDVLNQLQARTGTLLAAFSDGLVLRRPVDPTWPACIPATAASSAAPWARHSGDP